jgi:hypothetical protein
VVGAASLQHGLLSAASASDLAHGGAAGAGHHLGAEKRTGKDKSSEQGEAQGCRLGALLWLKAWGVCGRWRQRPCCMHSAPAVRPLSLCNKLLPLCKGTSSEGRELQHRLPLLLAYSTAKLQNSLPAHKTHACVSAITAQVAVSKLL